MSEDIVFAQDTGFRVSSNNYSKFFLHYFKAKDIESIEKVDVSGMWLQYC